MTDELKRAIFRFLVYSFQDINFEYRNLTALEKSFCTEEEFKQIVELLNKELKLDLDL